MSLGLRKSVIFVSYIIILFILSFILMSRMSYGKSKWLVGESYKIGGSCAVTYLGGNKIRIKGWWGIGRKEDVAMNNLLKGIKNPINKTFRFSSNCRFVMCQDYNYVYNAKKYLRRKVRKGHKIKYGNAYILIKKNRVRKIMVSY